MKITFPEIEKRIEPEISRSEGILTYDDDNLYPQRMKRYTNSSGTATSCIKLYAKFIRGKGFQDSNFYKTKVNKKGQTVDQILRLITKDKAQYNGYALHVNYNALGKIISLSHIPFENCRLGDETKAEYAFKVAVYDDWDCTKRSRIDKNLIVWYNKYDPRQDVVVQQMADAGNLDNYKGQILYVTEDSGYTLAPYDAIVEDIITDGEIKEFRLKSATSSFLASHAIEVPFEFESEDERKKYKESLEKFQGTRNANKVILIENPGGDSSPVKIHKLDLQNNDKIFELTNRTCKDSIIESFGQPPQLLGVAVAGKLGTADEIRDGFEFYNSHTEDERIQVEEVFTDIFNRWETTINPSGNYTIIPLSFGANTTNIAQ